LRLSSEEYSITDNQKDNIYVHLTNNAIQKNSSKYGQFESGNQLSFRDYEVTLGHFGDKLQYTSRKISKARIRRQTCGNLSFLK